MAQFIVPSATPNATTTAQSDRLRPRSEGRTQATSTTALVNSRSHTIVVGETSSNSDLANPAPSWTEAMPMSTRTTGRRLADIGPKPRACGSELVGLVHRDLQLLGRRAHAGLRDGGRDRRAVGARAAEHRRLADVAVGSRT